MQNRAAIEYQKLAYQMSQEIRTGELEYMYRGYFSNNITKSILGLAEVNLEKTEGQSALKKRIYFIMVEGLQNITRHQDEMENVQSDQFGLFVIERKHEEYFITTGNIIENQNIESLKEKLEKVNSLDSEELKKYYRQILTSGKISDKGGAGLGLIEMARKSGKKLLYDFTKVNEQFSYFYFQTEVPTPRKEMEICLDNHKMEIQGNQLQRIKDFHQILNDENIVFAFKGSFDQDHMLQMLSIFEGQMQDSAISIKVYNVMVELLQNIVKHGYNRDKDTYGNPGVFFINEKDNRFVLTSGNYIPNEKVSILRDKIEFVNSMELDDLADYYDRVLFNDMDINDPKKTGLGFIDMRLKGKQKINCDFYEVDENCSFFTLQVGILQKQNKK